MGRTISRDDINKIFSQLKIKAKVVNLKKEGAFVIFDVALMPGGKFRQIEKYSTEIALALKALSEPLIYPITQRGVVRIEIMVSGQGTVLFSDISSSISRSKFDLPLALGRQHDGKKVIADLAEMPHLLISGTTGSGKSILLHTIINSLLLGKKAKIALIDTKRVEFNYYNKISQLYTPIARDAQSAMYTLDKVIEEMEDRFKKLEQVKARSIKDYKGKMPYIIVVIDEFADLMLASKKETQKAICTLAQKSRACGIHLVIATQRPSVDVITGLIKANFPSRISCKVSSIIDSRTILGKSGGEKLTGKGDAIIDCPGHSFKRFKGAFISESEICDAAKDNRIWWKKLWIS